MAARIHSEAGAIAFTKFFLTQANLAFQKNDVSMIQPYFTTQCKTCAAIVGSISEQVTKELKFTGEFAHPVDVAIGTYGDDSTAKTFVASETSGSTLTDVHGAVVSTTPSASDNVSVFLVFGAEWKVTEIKSAG